MHRFSLPVANRRLRGHAAHVVLACMFGLGALPASADGPLNLEEALRLAQERSRQLPAHEAAELAAREMAVAAGRRPDPTLRAGINNLPVNGPDRFSPTRDFMTMRSVSVMQELTRGTKLNARSARLEREAEVAAASRERAVVNLRRDTAAAWLDRHYREGMREVLLSQREEATLQIQASEAAYRGGRGPQSDVFAARSAVALIDDRIAAAEQQIAVAITQLGRWIGPASAERMGVPPLLTTVRFRPDQLETHLAHHPEIALLTKREAMAQADVDVARANQKPDVTVELMYSQRGPAYSNMVSVNVSVPLQWDRRNRQDREVAAGLASLEQARAEREEATRMHVTEAVALWQEWQSNQSRLVRYDSSLIPLATEATRASLAAYRGASGSLASVLQSRRYEIDTRLERLRLEMETARLWAQLNFLIPFADGVPAGERLEQKP